MAKESIIQIKRQNKIFISLSTEINRPGRIAAKLISVPGAIHYLVAMYNLDLPQTKGPINLDIF